MTSEKVLRDGNLANYKMHNDLLGQKIGDILSCTISSLDGIH